MPAATIDQVPGVLAVARELAERCAEFTARIAAVPAPTNDESARARLVREMLDAEGYVDVHIDEMSNVVGRIPGARKSDRALLLAAHLDTVFPRDTPINVRRHGRRLEAPGIGDNSVSIAAAVLVHRAFRQLGWRPAVDILVTGNVGEEGLGDLRGMRAVLDAYPEVGAAIAIEGHTLGRITHQSVGSRRYRITLNGPGGHSWGDAGRPSAIHAAAHLVARLDTLRLPTQPKTSLNVGMFEGGISVNTIAPTATLVVDVRSVDAEVLSDVTRRVEREARAIRSNGIDVTIDVVGDRPAGRMPIDRGIVAVGISVLKALGIDAVCDASSTDANVPMSRGIPSMCIGLASGGNVHRTDEYIVLDQLPAGLAQLILVTAAVADGLGNDTLSGRRTDDGR